MWRNWNPLNPPINNVSSGEEDQNNYESADDDPHLLVSPNRPHQSASASPRALLRPDPPPAEEVLREVSQQLRALPSREERVANRNAVREAAEAAAAAAVVPHRPEAEPANMPPALPYDESSADNEEDSALPNAIRALKNLAWNTTDLKFYFNQAELKMRTHLVKKNYTKYLVLTSILPENVTEQLKNILRKSEAELGDKPYKVLKNQIFKLFGPPGNADFERAMGRVLSNTPSQLCREIINDLCETELVGCHCAKFIFGLWNRALPISVRQAISSLEFNAANLDTILQLADKNFQAGKVSTAAPGVASIVSQPSYSSLEGEPWNEAFHPSFPGSEGQVAAMSFQGRGGRGGRGGGRGGRGGRGNNRGGNRGGRGGGGNASGTATGGDSGKGNTQTHPRHKTPRHQDNPPVQACLKHWTWGKSAHWCQEPGTCPWKDYFIPKSNNQ